VPVHTKQSFWHNFRTTQLGCLLFSSSSRVPGRPLWTPCCMRQQRGRDQTRGNSRQTCMVSVIQVRLKAIGAAERNGAGLRARGVGSAHVRICCPHLRILHSLIPRPPTQHLCLQAHVQAPLRIAAVAYNLTLGQLCTYCARTCFSRLGWGLNTEFEHGFGGKSRWRVRLQTGI